MGVGHRPQAARPRERVPLHLQARALQGQLRQVHGRTAPPTLGILEAMHRFDVGIEARLQRGRLGADRGRHRTQAPRQHPRSKAGPEASEAKGQGEGHGGMGRGGDRNIVRGLGHDDRRPWPARYPKPLLTPKGWTMKAWTAATAALLLGTALGPTLAQTPAPAPYDAALAQRTGANANGMRAYVLVLLKSSDTPLPKGEARDAMFRGHFANMKRLAEAGVLVVAGPLDGQLGRRGLFVMAVPDIETAKTHVATDPVIVQGEMVAEYHRFYSSAALMLVPELAPKLAAQPM